MLQSVKTHTYALNVAWPTAGAEDATTSYSAYSRNHDIGARGKEIPLPASSDPAFRGDPARYNPEELLVASLSGCHMLWVLHLAARDGVVVTDYEDHPSGTMLEQDDGSGRFVAVTLRPRVTVRDASMVKQAASLHEEAHRLCFIANSVNFPVLVEPTFSVKP